MKDTPLNRFVARVMNIEAGYAGLGTAAAGILGAAGTNGQIITNLRRSTLTFASAYAEHPDDSQTLTGYSQQLESALYSLKLINNITDESLNSLVDELQALMAKVGVQKA